MDSGQNNKLAMYVTTLVELQSPSCPLKDIPAAGPKIAALAAKVDAINELNNTQAQARTGAVDARDQQLEATRQIALLVCGAVRSYAAEKELRELHAKVRFKPSDFTAGRLVKQVQIAQQVHDAAVPVVAELADYKVTPAVLADFLTKITTAKAGLNRPRTSQAAQKAATGQLPTRFREADALLEDQIDPLVFPLAKTHPDFYAKYQAARIIIDRGGGRTDGDSEPPFPPPAPNTTPPPAPTT